MKQTVKMSHVDRAGHCSLCKREFVGKVRFAIVELLAKENWHYLFCRRCVTAMARAIDGKAASVTADRGSLGVAIPTRHEAKMHHGKGIAS